ncbi:SusC/RagA family TonB-linked outer membrane protein [Carboxylicivirga sp. N1Y90]|uniref:SusC/RagA family TonB-linked outer membrane protein n=1 Tax=Carboxylicivirga fragile TaxID=3417571 RepID=UPI003D34930F|nr:SusC/RagA family TonB-linked outer membrane protein [Marinilabiliaceae bacterium N1Y90]
MRRLALILSLFVFVGMNALLAQTKTITGTITGSEDGEPIPGVSVVVKGTTIGTITRVDGTYSLSVPEDATNLLFSFVGMTTEDIAIGGESVINVSMVSEAIGVGEVVVTALGLEVSKDKMASATSTIKSDALANTGESGVIQGLAGKTSGLSIVKNTGDPGAGAYIQIRGQNSITGSIQPLVVVDGVPMINSSRGGDIDGVVQQSRMNDLNPNDIESVDVLKGAAAAAVWGTRAANGVIVITTKAGKSGSAKKINVNVFANFSWDKVSTEFKKQGIYGQGRYGSFEANRGESWGDKISERAGGDDLVDTSGGYFESVGGAKYYPITEKRSTNVYNDANRDQVFRTGFTSEIGGSVTLNNDRSSSFISLSNWDQQGVINGNSDYKRTTLRINYTSNPTDNVRFKLNTFYSGITSDRVQQGSNLNGLYLGYLRTSPDFDNTHYKGTYYGADGKPSYNAHRSYRRYLGDRPPTYNNPGWTINEQVNTSTVQRLMLNPEVQIDLLEGLNTSSKLTARYGLDLSNDKRHTFFPVNSAADFSSGYFEEEYLIERESTLEAFVRTVHNLGETNFSWILGTQYNTRNYNYLGGSMSNFINTLDQIYDFDNASDNLKTPSKFEEEQRTFAGYLVANLELWDQLILDATVRTEKSNAFKDAIVYPSISGAWQFSKAMESNSILTFGKLRASIGTVGVEPPLYVSRTDYVPGSVGSGWGATLDASQYSGGLQRSTVEGNPNIEPEKKTEFEIGTDMRFLNDYLNLSFTYYQNETVGAIFAVDVPASTGYTSRFENAATLSNKGIELDLTGTLVRNGDFKWDVLFNFSKNKNMVDDLKGVKSIFLNGFTGTSSRAVEGHALGTLWGGKWARTADGKLDLDENGFPQQALEEGVIGDPNPDFRAGLGTTLSFKGLSLNVLFETSQGGDMWAGSEAVLRHFGISPRTANEVTLGADMQNYWGETIAAGSTVRGNVHNFGGGDVLLDQAWYTGLGGGFGSVSEDFIHDASYIRLREISMTYSLPKSIISPLKLQNVNVSLIGRNLALWSDFADEFGVDPETNLTGVSNGRGLDYFTNPSTQSYMVKINIGF